MSNNSNKAMKDTPKIWNDTEVKLLKKWGEQAASYRVLHNRAYRKYKYLTALFTIPVIIISTLTGTANFSQGTIIQIYPSFDLYLPLVIGALNLISGIVTTIGQFLRVSELNEAHRNASISYGKFSRNISTELSLPPLERTYCGLDFIQICRNEMDRLIEQSPEIGMKIINKFEQNRKFKHIIKPELINISPIEVYKPSKEEKAKEMVAGAASKFRNKFLTNKLTDLEPNKDSSSKFTEFSNKRNVELELAELRDNKVANNLKTKSKVSAIFENNNETSENNLIPDMNNIKNKFKEIENKGINDYAEVKKSPPKKISLTDLVTNDNMNIIKKEKQRELELQKPEVLDNSVIIDVNLLKEDLLKNIDETLEKADLDKEQENKIIEDISKSYKKKTSSKKKKKSKRTLVDTTKDTIINEKQ